MAKATDLTPNPLSAAPGTASGGAAAAPDASAVAAALDQAQDSLQELQQLAQPMALPDLAGPGGAGATANPIALLSDVDLHVAVELGRTHMLVEDVLRLSEGSIVELDKLAGDPVDVYVNQRLIARGEVLVLNDNFCIRISEIVANLDEEARAAEAEGVGH